jgi:serine O-acetyltransferase
MDSVYPIPDQISGKIPDWSRETPRQFWDPERKLLRAICRYQFWSKRADPLPVLMRKLLVLRYRFWSVLTGADNPLNCQIGGGLLVPHPNGIVIHPDAKIGVNYLIFSTSDDRQHTGPRRFTGQRPCRYWHGAKI